MAGNGGTLYNPSIWEAKAGRLPVQSHFRLYSKVKMANSVVWDVA